MTGNGAIGACYGFGVRSSLPFSYLRAGGGAPLTVSAPSPAEGGEAGEVVLEWAATAGFPLPGRLLRDGAGFRLWVDTWGWFHVDPDAGHVTLPDAEDVVRREERLWSIPAALCFQARGDLGLHAAAVEVDGEAIVLAAPGTFGKTTLAAAFHAAGHRLLSEDTTCVRTDGDPAIVPGPAMVRLRHDVAGQLDLPRARVVARSEEKVHLALDGDSRGDCSPVPLRAVVLLDGIDDGFRLTRATPQDAVRDLFALGFRLPNDADRARCFTATADVAGAVPVWRFRRPLTIRDLPATVEHLAAHV